MITPPTDNLYKFLAIFGILLVFSSSAFWWNSANEFDSFFESNDEYVNVLIEGNEANVKFIEKVKEGIAIYNSVSGDYDKLSPAQKEKFDKVLEESENLKSASEFIEKQNKAKFIIVNSRLEKDRAAKYIGISGILLGSLISVFGFYLWHSRLQKYIDKLQKNAKA